MFLFFHCSVGIEIQIPDPPVPWTPLELGEGGETLVGVPIVVACKRAKQTHYSPTMVSAMQVLVVIAHRTGPVAHGRGCRAGTRGWSQRTSQRVRRTARRGERVFVVVNWPWNKVGVRGWYT